MGIGQCVNSKACIYLAALAVLVGCAGHTHASADKNRSPNG